MRKLKRSIARNMMQLAGIERINKKNRAVFDKNGKDTGKRVSYFSLHWRDFVEPSKTLSRKINKASKRRERANAKAAANRRRFLYGSSVR